jgi:CRISPR/Cas system CSM-associated protein Csm3 (group 7 of RAMP superfamily)
MRFAELRCEARWTFDLETVTPLSIRSATAGNLDPRRPDMEVVRTRLTPGGPAVPYMPGSSVRGVLRARAGRILNTIVRDPPPPGREGWRVEDLFGHVNGQDAARGRLAVADAHPVGSDGLPAAPHTATRSQAAIDRVSGHAARGALFVPEVVEQGRFRCEMTVTNFAQWHLRVLAWVLLDVDEGYVTFGGGASRGLGRMRVHPGSVRLRDFRGPDLRDTDGRRIALSGDTIHGRLCFEAVLPDHRPLLDDAVLPDADPRNAARPAPEERGTARGGGRR